MASWAPAWDHRIRASVSNWGCIPYRDSLSRDVGLQADIVIPGFARDHDIEDILELAHQRTHLVIAGQDDVEPRC